MSTPLRKPEIIFGSIYGLVQFLLLPEIAFLLHNIFHMPMWILQAAVFGVNFLCTILIFRHFLLASCKTALSTPLKTAGFTALGLVLYYIGSFTVSILILYLQPDYLNLNDAGISSLAQDGGLWIAAGTVLLVPVAEECLFRGLLFRGIYDRSPVAAWIVSAGCFSAVHILGYVGVYDSLALVLAFLQYLPAGLTLSYAYRASGTILTPILMHTVINLIGISILIL